VQLSGRPCGLAGVLRIQDNTATYDGGHSRGFEFNATVASDATLQVEKGNDWRTGHEAEAAARWPTVAMAVLTIIPGGPGDDALRVGGAESEGPGHDQIVRLIAALKALDSRVARDTDPEQAVEIERGAPAPAAGSSRRAASPVTTCPCTA
jgi:hypothetical protein